MTNNAIIARAYTNIALIKYWGKRDETLFLPMNSSLSLTLDAFYTDTKVSINTKGKTDQFYLNGQQQTADNHQAISRFINLFYTDKTTRPSLFIESYNHVPTAAGLASSSSAFAALAFALNKFSELNLSNEVLSTYARQGSGSATRSLYGGFVEWQKGADKTDSKAIFIDDASWDIAMIFLLLNKEEKAISSRQGMQHTVDTSPFYKAWVELATNDLARLKEAIKKQDFITLGEITEANGMAMHATMLASRLPFTYLSGRSIEAITLVKELRKSGFSCYYTMDAGPNVKILCRQSEVGAILNKLKKVYNDEEIMVAKPGVAPYFISNIEWQESIKQHGK